MEFREQKNVAIMNQGFFHSIAQGGLVRIDGAVTPTSGFSLSTQLICEVIKERKYLVLQ